MTRQEFLDAIVNYIPGIILVSQEYYQPIFRNTEIDHLHMDIQFKELNILPEALSTLICSIYKKIKAENLDPDYSFYYKMPSEVACTIFLKDNFYMRAILSYSGLHELYLLTVDTMVRRHVLQN